MHIIHGADRSTATSPISHTNASTSPATTPRSKSFTVISDITVDDAVATRLEWKRLWERLLAPCRDDAA